MSETHQSWTEEFKVSGEELLRDVEQYIHDGNVSHIVIKNAEHVTLVEFPITVGVIGFLIAPILAAVAAIAVYAANFTVVVTRVGPTPPPVID